MNLKTINVELLQWPYYSCAGVLVSNLPFIDDAPEELPLLDYYIMDVKADSEDSPSDLISRCPDL